MADVVDDMEHILDRAIQCLTQILNALIGRVDHNRHRPLTRRTLVRWISILMPTPKDPRVFLAKNLGEGRSSSCTLERWGSCGSLTSAFSVTSLQNLVEEDLGDNLVRFRVGSGQDDAVFSDSIDGRCFRPISERFTSTPNVDQSESAGQDDKISEMEKELANLRQQIAMLVMAQESSMLDCKEGKSNEEEGSDTLSNSAVAADLPLPFSPVPSCSTLNDSGCESSEGVPVTTHCQTLEHALGQTLGHTLQQTQEHTPGVLNQDGIHSEKKQMSAPCISIPAPPAPPPPAPAPPPPPPLPISRREMLGDLIKKRRESRSLQFTSRDSRDTVPVMSDVLKGLGSVKLRAIDRSPGGTPMCRRKMDDRTPTDPAAIIARALRRKFASHRGLSPESDQENDNVSFVSDGSPFGQHMLKKTKRRLSLCNDSDDWTTVSSPLKTLNL